MSKLSYPDLEEVRRQTLNCFGNLCSNLESKFEEVEKIFEILIENLEFYSKLNLKDYSKVKMKQKKILKKKKKVFE